MSEVLKGFLGDLENAQKMLSSYEQQREYLKKEVDALARKKAKLEDDNKQLDILLNDKKVDFEKSKKSFIKNAEDRNVELGKRELQLKADEAELQKKADKLSEKEYSYRERVAQFSLAVEAEKEKAAPKSESFKKAIEKLSK